MMARIVHSNGSWFKDKPWLEYSVERDACYYYACHFFNSIGSDSFFANFNGFRDWKHAPGNKGSLSLHSSSRLHTDAINDFGLRTPNLCPSGRSHRRTQPPRRLENCFATSDAPTTHHRFNSCEEYHFDLYYMPIDCILMKSLW